MPKLLTTPFASEATSEYRTDVQNTTGAELNSATYEQGFPPITMEKIAMGGKPPKGSDLNGVLYDITDNIVSLTKGARYGFNEAYANAIGGYPLGAVLRLDNGIEVESEVDSNSINPNVDMTGWKFAVSDNGIVTWSGRTQREKNKDIVSALDYNFTGLGDESTKLKNLFSNNIVVLQNGAVYTFNEVINLQNIIIFANNATLRLLTNISDWAVKFNANVQIIGKLNIEVPDGYGARIYGNNFKADELEILSIAQSENYGFQVQTANTDTYVKNCRIGKVTTVNFLSQQQLFRVKKSWFGSLICDTYRTGVYLRDVQDSQIDYIEAKTMRVNSSGDAGQNGFLMEATKENKSCRNLKISHIHIEDSPEHGVRFGGLYTIQDVTIDSIYTKNTGASPTSTGGSSVKILGGNNARPTYNLHEDISIGTIISVDCQVGTGLNNFSALTLSHVKNVKIQQHTVRKENNPTFSARRGLHLTCCEDVTIANQDYKDTQVNGVMFYSGEVEEMKAYDVIKNIRMPNYNSISTSINSASIYFTGTYTKVSDVIINGSCIQDIYVRSEAITSDGLYKDINITLKSNPVTTDLSAKAPPIQCPNTLNGIIVNIVGKWFGTYGASCSDGSAWVDPTRSDRNYLYRVAGTWRSPTMT